jgi:enolase-phosphatase E1
MSEAISHVLLDIEGTTCPMSFVSDNLFPYAARELGPYLERHSHEAGVEKLVQAVIQAWQQDSDPKAKELWKQAQEGTLPQAGNQTAMPLEGKTIEPYLQWLIAIDRKLTPLKELQGLVWADGYAKGELIGDLFEEAPATLRHWHQQGLVLAVYSSGSVTAQKLLYGHSQAGDLRPLFRHWFDTHTGGKHEVDSYTRICTAMEVEPQRVLFISDSEAEIQAAKAANLRVILSERDGSLISGASSSPHKTTEPENKDLPARISDLSQIQLNAPQP